MRGRTLQDFETICRQLDPYLDSSLANIFRVSRNDGFPSEANYRYTAKTLLCLSAFMYIRQGFQDEARPGQDDVPFPALLFAGLSGAAVSEPDADALHRLWEKVVAPFRQCYEISLSHHKAARLVLDVLQERAIARGQALSVPLLPSGVARLMLGLAQASPKERFLDLCPGLGVLPAEAILASQGETAQPCVMAGVFAEQLLRLCALPSDKFLPRSDALETKKQPVMEADVACSMGAALSAGDNGQREAECLQRHLTGLAPLQGRAVLLASPSLLFRQGEASSLRTTIMERNVLDAVLLLPGNAFYGSNAQFALLVFDRGRETGGPRSRKKDVFMLDLAAFADSDTQDCFWQQSKNLNYFETQHIQKICTLMQERKEQAGISRHTPCERLIAENVWLPSRFLHNAAYNWRAERAEYQNLESSLPALSRRLTSLLDSLEHDFLKIGEQRKRDDDAAS